MELSFNYVSRWLLQVEFKTQVLMKYRLIHMVCRANGSPFYAKRWILKEYYVRAS